MNLIVSDLTVQVNLEDLVKEEEAIFRVFEYIN